MKARERRRRDERAAAGVGVRHARWAPLHAEVRRWLEQIIVDEPDALRACLDGVENWSTRYAALEPELSLGPVIAVELYAAHAAVGREQGSERSFWEFGVPRLIRLLGREEIGIKRGAALALRLARNAGVDVVTPLAIMSTAIACSLVTDDPELRDALEACGVQILCQTFERELTSSPIGAIRLQACAVELLMVVSRALRGTDATRARIERLIPISAPWLRGIAVNATADPILTREPTEEDARFAEALRTAIASRPGERPPVKNLKLFRSTR